jgi:group I intron endonuclease
MIIYKVTNLVNNKIYIGQSSYDLEYRKKSHYKAARLNSQLKFHKAIRKYKDTDFEWKIIAEVSLKNDADFLERKFIIEYDSLKNGYNMTNGGEGGDTISMKPLKDKKNQGAKKGNIPWNKGKDMKNMGYRYDNRCSRQPFTDEQKKLHSLRIKSSKKYKSALKTRTPAKQVIIEDSNGNVWNKQKDLISYLGISHHAVRNGLKSGIWQYNGITYKVLKRK